VGVFIGAAKMAGIDPQCFSTQQIGALSFILVHSQGAFSL